MKKKKLTKKEREEMNLLAAEIQPIYNVNKRNKEITVPYLEVEHAFSIIQVKELCSRFRFHIQTVIA